MKKGEQVVQNLLNFISEFECFPFDPATPTLIQSAIPALDKLIAFLEEYIFAKVKSLFDSVPKNKCLTFANEKKKLLHQEKIK